jgi:hypothetical protein
MPPNLTPNDSSSLRPAISADDALVPPPGSNADEESSPAIRRGFPQIGEILEVRPPFSTASPGAVRLPGPGLPEALLWTGGTLVTHIVAGIVVVCLLLLLDPPRLGSELREQIEATLEQQQVNLMGGEQVLFAFAAVVAVALRLRPEIDRRLALPQFLSVRHISLILVLVLPMSVVCSSLYPWAEEGWHALSQKLPGLQLFDSFETMEALEPLADDASLGMLLVFMALAPALAEELVFRGIIGRGLIARWGIWRGVLLTSCLFGLVHVYPPHVVSVIPLGIAMHALYLLTRSFWAPVLLHFCNNAWAAVVLQGRESLLADAVAAENTAVPVDMQLASALLVGGVFWILWQTRVRYVLPDGSDWTPGYAHSEAPPADSGVCRVVRRPSRTALAFGVICGVILLGVFLKHAWNTSPNGTPEIDSEIRPQTALLSGA